MPQFATNNQVSNTIGATSCMANYGHNRHMNFATEPKGTSTPPTSPTNFAATVNELHDYLRAEMSYAPDKQKGLRHPSPEAIRK